MQLEEIEGIGPTYAAKLAEHRLSTTDHVLEHAGSATGRVGLAEKSGISDKLILEWVNHADRCRIGGVGGEYADLLESAGVDTAATPERANAENLVRRVPTETEIARWVDQAKGLPRAVQH